MLEAALAKLRRDIHPSAHYSDAGCVELALAPNNKGYCSVYSQELKRREGAHRAAYRAFKGAIPPNACVMHTCDNPGCINPHHLRLGSYRDNLVDAIEKGRHHPPLARKGVKHPNAKLTDAAIQFIRTHYRKRGSWNLVSLAKKYGVGTSAVHRVVKCQTYPTP